LHDRVDEAGNQKFGFYRPDYSRRPAATYLHNLTTILADRSSVRREEKLGYRIQEPPTTVHDLLLHKGNGDFELLVWNEQVKGSASVRIDFEAALSSVKLFDVTVGTEAIQTLANVTDITMNLSNHPVVFEMKSGGGHPR
jgi:hypothetical protein